MDQAAHLVEIVRMQIALSDADAEFLVANLKSQRELSDQEAASANLVFRKSLADVTELLAFSVSSVIEDKQQALLDYVGTVVDDLQFFVESSPRRYQELHVPHASPRTDCMTDLEQVLRRLYGHLLQRSGWQDEIMALDVLLACEVHDQMLAIYQRAPLL
mmetsp:Transcript_126357/g.223794  ORF Transcript_126357/g.223794 Transcript_126357/m.223794 type:complete len:160 (+) Transcript_126357:103-582(+)